MPSFAAQACAVFSLRDEIATISMSLLFNIPGRTFPTPMSAVEMTPHFTAAMISSLDFLSRCTLIQLLSQTNGQAAIFHSDFILLHLDGFRAQAFDRSSVIRENRDENHHH